MYFETAFAYTCTFVGKTIYILEYGFYDKNFAYVESLQPYFQRQEQEEGRRTIDSLFRSSLQCLYGFRFYVIYHINSSCQTQVIDLFRQKNYFGGS